MIKMDALCKMYTNLNLVHVQSYIQSGNVIFQCNESNEKDIEKQISEKIVKDFGFEVPVMVKEMEQLNFIFMNNPFILENKKDISKVHVTFLSQQPDQSNLKKITGISFAPDEFIVRGKTVYLYCPNGYGRTKLTNNFFENKLKAVATTRNWKTIHELVDRAMALSKI